MDLDLLIDIIGSKVANDVVDSNELVTRLVHVVFGLHGERVEAQMEDLGPRNGDLEVGTLCNLYSHVSIDHFLILVLLLDDLFHKEVL